MKLKRMVQAFATRVPGETKAFASGSAYTVQDDGSVKRANPKSYKNKAERKRQKRERRDERLA